MKPDEVGFFFNELLHADGGQPQDAAPAVQLPGVRRKRRNDDEELKADRKRERERKRRAEVGEKFEELSKVLQAAEEVGRSRLHKRAKTPSGADGAAGGHRDGDDEASSRVDVLNRAIGVIMKLTAQADVDPAPKPATTTAAASKHAAEQLPSVEERTAVGGLLGVAALASREMIQNGRAATVAHKACQTVASAPAHDDDVVVQVIASTAMPRSQLEALMARRDRSVVFPASGLSSSSGVSSKSRGARATNNAASSSAASGRADAFAAAAATFALASASSPAMMMASSATSTFSPGDGSLLASPGAPPPALAPPAWGAAASDAARPNGLVVQGGHHVHGAAAGNVFGDGDTGGPQPQPQHHHPQPQQQQQQQRGASYFARAA